MFVFESSSVYLWRMKHMIFSILFFITYLAHGQTSSDKLFKGGMMLHSGQVSVVNSHHNAQGACYGLGGKLAFYLSPKFRVGGEGYSSTFRYQQKESYNKLGWGGVLFEYIVSTRQIQPVFGVTFGGGSSRDIYLLNGSIDDNVIDEVIYKKTSTLIAAPYISVEYELSNKITTVFKVDYLFPVSTNDAFAEGIRCYIGILFSK